MRLLWKPVIRRLFHQLNYFPNDKLNGIKALEFGIRYSDLHEEWQELEFDPATLIRLELIYLNKPSYFTPCETPVIHMKCRIWHAFR